MPTTNESLTTEELKQKTKEVSYALTLGVCTLRYTKLDGEVRLATGTKNWRYIPTESQSQLKEVLHEESYSKPFSSLVKYYDLGAKGWRSFHVENLDLLTIKFPEQEKQFVL